MYLSFYLEFLFLLSVIFTAASSSVSQGPYLSSPRRCLSEGWPYLRRQHITSMNTKFVKIRSSNLKNQILQFFKNFKLSSSTNRTNDPKTSPPPWCRAVVPHFLFFVFYSVIISSAQCGGPVRFSSTSATPTVTWPTVHVKIT
jgi:hypothetical protein